MSEPLNLEHLEKVRAAATQGEWVRHDTSSCIGVASGNPNPKVAYLTNQQQRRICYLTKMGRFTDVRDANIEYIVTFDPPTTDRMLKGWAADRQRVGELEKELFFHKEQLDAERKRAEYEASQQ